MLVSLAADPPDWTAPRFEGPALSRMAEPGGTAPDILAPGIADLPKLQTLSNRTLAWAAFSLLIHGAVLVWLTRTDVPPVTDAMEGTPVEVISAADLAPLAVEADALVSAPEMLVAEAPRLLMPEEAAPPESQPDPSITVLENAPALTVGEAAPQPAPEPAPQPNEVAELPAPEPLQEPAPLAALAPPQPPAKPAPKPVPLKVAPARPAATSTHEPQRTPAAAPAARPAASGPDLAAWHGSIFSRLRAAMRYPDGARARGAIGQASVAFSLDSGGRVTSASVVHSSGHADLDSEAGAIVRRASPFPPPPPGAPRSMTVPINFRLR